MSLPEDSTLDPRLAYAFGLLDFHGCRGERKRIVIVIVEGASAVDTFVMVCLSVCAIWAATERIKNLFDRSPRFTNAQQNNFAAGYNALVADPLLRNFYVNLKYTFF